MLFIVPSARADLVHRLSTSTQLTVNGAATSATRIGSTYSVSGSNIRVGTGNSDVFGGLTAGSATAAATYKAGTYDINTAGSAFSFSEGGDKRTPPGEYTPPSSSPPMSSHGKPPASFRILAFSSLMSCRKGLLVIFILLFPC